MKGTNGDRRTVKPTSYHSHSYTRVSFIAVAITAAVPADAGLLRDKAACSRTRQKTRPYVTATFDGQSVFIWLSSTFCLPFQRCSIKVRPDYSCSHLCVSTNVCGFICLSNGTHRGPEMEWFTIRRYCRESLATAHRSLNISSDSTSGPYTPAGSSQRQVAWTHLYKTTCSFTYTLPKTAPMVWRLFTSLSPSTRCTSK